MCVKAVRALAQAAERCGPTQMSTAQVNERIRALRQLACAKRQPRLALGSAAAEARNPNALRLARRALGEGPGLVHALGQRGVRARTRQGAGGFTGLRAL